MDRNLSCCRLKGAFLFKPLCMSPTSRTNLVLVCVDCVMLARIPSRAWFFFLANLNTEIVYYFTLKPAFMKQ